MRTRVRPCSSLGFVAHESTRLLVLSFLCIQLTLGTEEALILQSGDGILDLRSSFSRSNVVG